MENDKLCQKRLRKTKRVGAFLACLPFVRCVILNGSLAQGKSKESSDIDLLIIAKSGRIFTARFFVNAFASTLGIKRPKDESKIHADKFCFNYFLTEDFLTIPTGRGEKMDKYCAENYSASKFIAGDRELFEKFILANQELFRKFGCKITKSKLQISNKNPNYKFKNNITFPQCHPRFDRGSRKLLYRFRISSLQSGMTPMRFGNLFEKYAKTYQIKKIESDPRTKKYQNLIVYNDNELRFHPSKYPKA